MQYGRPVVLIVLLAIGIPGPLSAGIPDRERSALIALYDATGGTQWKTRTGWGGAAGTECTWYGVTCDTSGSSVTALDLRKNGLAGTLPVQIGDLPNLSELRLADNGIGGTLPAGLFSLTNLVTLDCDNNRFSGALPPDIGRLQKLENLWFYDNMLKGEIPPELTALAALRSVDLTDNAFTGPLPPDIEGLSALEYVSFSNNHLTGAIPPGVGRLKKLTDLWLGGNDLSGPVPPLNGMTSLEDLQLANNRLSGSIPDLRPLKLHFIGLNRNQFTGAIPDMFAGMPDLWYFDAGENLLSGEFPRSLVSCPALEFILLESNQLSGPIPADIGNLKELWELDLSENAFSGLLPDSLSELTKLAYLTLYDNEFSGKIPPQIGNLTALKGLSFEGNRLTGAIPPDIARLQALQWINLSMNDLSGPLPSEIQNLSNLQDTFSSFDFNRLYTNDAALLAFLKRKDYLDFPNTQTVPPTDLKITGSTDRSISLQWTPIGYDYGEGGYQVSAALTPSGPPVAITSTSVKWSTGAVLRGLAASTKYYITVRTVSYPWYLQRNVLVSEPAAMLEATTGPPALSPADVAVTAEPRGLVQIDGVAQNEDSFTLTNFGDAATTLVLQRRGSFFTVTPAEFALPSGATQSVSIRSIAEPAGSYSGSISVVGDGAKDLRVVVTLLSAARPAGTVSAEPVAQRIEIVGTAGTTSLGTATFRNTGDGFLNGIVVADVPWIIPSSDSVLIIGGSSESVPFTIDRSRRPLADGSLTGNLSLVYVAGIGSSLAALANDTPSSVKVSTVTVIDIAKPQVTAGTVPPLGTGEVGYFVPVVAAMNQMFGSMVTDLAIVNAFGTKPLTDLQLYFTPAGATKTALASLGAIAGSQSVNLANVVSSVYGSSDPAGMLQVRSANWDALKVVARLLSLGKAGTYGSDVPVFRSDRSAEGGAQTILTGLRQEKDLRTSISIQETSGHATTARVELFDSAGQKSAERDVAIGAFGLVVLADIVTERTVTAVITTEDFSSGHLSAYATVFDDSSGESWSIVDWSRQRDFKHTVPLRVLLAGGEGSPSSPRRRVARHGSGTHGSGLQSDGVSQTTTQLSIFNPLETEGVVAIRYVAAGRPYQKDLHLAAHQTALVGDVVAFTGAVASGDATLAIEPAKGELVITGRMCSGSAGTALPVVADLSGLRLGKTAIFCGLEDSSAATIAAAKPGTYRTTYGFLETGNAPVTVRVTVLLSDGRSLVSAVATRQYELSAHQLLVVPDMVKSIVGSDRDARYPDLHNLQLQVEVAGGSGSVVPFVMITDNATGDSMMRIE